MHTSELRKVEFLANWSEHFTDTMIINLTNKTNYIIKELEFWFMDKKCSNFDSNSNYWPNKMQETFLVNFEPNQKLAIRINDLDTS